MKQKKCKALEARAVPSISIVVRTSLPALSFFLFDFLFSWIELLRGGVNGRILLPIIEDLVIVLALVTPMCIATYANDRLRVR